MITRLWRRRPSHATLVAYLALALALSTGTAYAANTIGSSDIIDESILSQDVHNGTLTAGDLAMNTIGSGRVQNNSLQSIDVLDGSLTGADIADGSVGSDDLATDAVTAPKIADDSIDGGEIIDNSLAAVDLAPNSVAASELAANAVNSAKVSGDSLTLADLAGVDVQGAISLSGIPNGRCNQVTFSIGGAAVGDVPMVTTGAPVQNGIVLYAQRVASAGHVEVDACNFSGGDMTAINDFPIRVITFR